MNQTYSSLETSLKKITDDAIRKGFFSQRDQRDLKALDQLIESCQDEANEVEWLLLFNIRNEISDLLDSEMAIHFWLKKRLRF